MDTKKKLIFIVEDEPEMAWALRIQLEGSGFRCIHVPSGEAAIKKLQLEKPDLVLLDLILPGMDGFKVCKLIKESGATRHIPVVVLTAKDQLKDMEEGLDSGADKYLTKPYDPERLIEVIKSCLK